MVPMIHLFFRDVRVSGRMYRQGVVVHAGDAMAAEQLLREHLEACRTRPGQLPVDVAAAYEPSGNWRTHTVPLDRPKVVSAYLTS